jgi:hypothetical protein
VKEVNRLQSVLLHATTREERTSLLDRLFEAEQRLKLPCIPHHRSSKRFSGHCTRTRPCLSMWWASLGLIAST